MSQFRYDMAFERPHSGDCDCGCGCGCGRRSGRCDRECYIEVGTVIDDCNMARNCSCNYRCCICGGWCGADCICTRCENPCVDNCDKCDDDCGCGCGCGRRGRDCGCDRERECGCRRRGLICVHKVSRSNPATPLAGAEFELQNARGVVIATGTTNADGDVCFHNLRNGTYQLRETAAPAGYELNTDITSIDLTPCEHRVFLEVTNAPLAGTVTATAIDAAAPATTFPNISISLINSSMESIATVVTDAAGVATFSNVPYGTYSLIPLNSPAGYTPPGIPATVTVSAATPNPTATIGFTEIPT